MTLAIQFILVLAPMALGGLLVRGIIKGEL